MNCKHCNQEALSGYQTCGSSYCQELSFFQNLLRNNKRSKSKVKEATRRIAEIDEIIFRRKGNEP